jgi:hypothetical protein
MKRAAESLIALLRHPSVEILYNAVLALGTMRCRRARSALERIAGDDHRKYRGQETISQNRSGRSRVHRLRTTRELSSGSPTERPSRPEASAAWRRLGGSKAPRRPPSAQGWVFVQIDGTAALLPPVRASQVWQGSPDSLRSAARWIASSRRTRRRSCVGPRQVVRAGACGG